MRNSFHAAHAGATSILGTSCLHTRHTRAAHARNHANAHVLSPQREGSSAAHNARALPKTGGTAKRNRSEHWLLSVGGLPRAGLPLRLTRRADHRTLPQPPFGVGAALSGRTPPTDVRWRTHSHTRYRAHTHHALTMSSVSNGVAYVVALYARMCCEYLRAHSFARLNSLSDPTGECGICSAWKAVASLLRDTKLLLPRYLRAGPRLDRPMPKQAQSKPTNGQRCE